MPNDPSATAHSRVLSPRLHTVAVGGAYHLHRKTDRHTDKPQTDKRDHCSTERHRHQPPGPVARGLVLASFLRAHGYACGRHGKSDVKQSAEREYAPARQAIKAAPMLVSIKKGLQEPPGGKTTKPSRDGPYKKAA